MWGKYLWARKFDLKIIAIRDLIAYRLKSESLVEKGVEVDMPTEYLSLIHIL